MILCCFFPRILTSQQVGITSTDAALNCEWVSTQKSTAWWQWRFGGDLIKAWRWRRSEQLHFSGCMDVHATTKHLVHTSFRKSKSWCCKQTQRTSYTLRPWLEGRNYFLKNALSYSMSGTCLHCEGLPAESSTNMWIGFDLDRSPFCLSFGVYWGMFSLVSLLTDV